MTDAERAERLADIRNALANDAKSNMQLAARFLLAELDRVTAERDEARIAAEGLMMRSVAAGRERDAALADVKRLREALIGLMEEHTDCASCDVCEPGHQALAATAPKGGEG
jgi:hypothetical protein